MSANILVTGASGEIGSSLIPKLAETKAKIVALDVQEPRESTKNIIQEFANGSVLNRSLVHALIVKNKIDTIFHLAAILSTAAEKNPEKASMVNVSGTTTVIETANNIALKEKRVIKIIFPSTIAVYGINNAETKNKLGALKENQNTTPITIYGINKLYCEMVGKYYSENYKMLDNNINSGIDFRSVRLPGVISALTLPSGGTSDYAPEMIHSAAKGEGYESFVRADSILPFMVMPDAIKALIAISLVPKEKLTQSVYNVTSFSATTEQIAQIINKTFPDSAISYNPDGARQRIVDSWPAATDDSKARTDWGWQADYDITKAFQNYLIPEIKKQYNS